MATSSICEACLRFPSINLLLSEIYQKYATVAGPLIDLLKKDSFNWTAVAQQAFNILKQAMTIALVLALQNFALLFVFGD